MMWGKIDPRLISCNPVSVTQGAANTWFALIGQSAKRIALLFSADVNGNTYYAPAQYAVTGAALTDVEPGIMVMSAAYGAAQELTIWKEGVSYVQQAWSTTNSTGNRFGHVVSVEYGGDLGALIEMMMRG